MSRIILPIIASAVIGYLIGCINLAYIFSKLKGYDIRKHGSGNAGASNVIIVMGKKMGVVVMAADIFKAYFAVKICVQLFSDFHLAGVIAATAVILGHIFPFYMGFKGGKGFASLGGSILALDMKMFLVLLIFAVVICFVTNYICFGPTSVSVIFSLAYGYFSKSLASTMILLIAAVCIIYRHFENFKRIREGTELKFSFLWNREAEAKRFGVKDDDGDFPFEEEEKGFEMQDDK